MITRSTPGIARYNPSWVRISKDVLSFSKGAVELCGMEGKYLKFERMDGSWLFTVTDDEDGFYVQRQARSNKQSDKGAFYRVHSTGLIRMMTKDIRWPLPAKFYVQKSDLLLEGYPVFEIISHKPISKIGS